MKRGIDHLVLAVRDLDAAIDAYHTFGFTTTPRALHPWGTANSLVQLQGNFLELLEIAEPEKIEPAGPDAFSFGAFNQDFLEKREGFSMLVFESDDARRDRQDFADKGLTTYAPFDFSRQATLPDGSTATVAFSLAFVTDDRMPDAAFFVCQQHAPEYFWKPDFQQHANGARRISEVVMVAERPETLAEHFAKLQGSENVSSSEGGLSIETARGRVAVLTPERFGERFPLETGHPSRDGPHFAGFQVEVAALSEVETVLDRRGVQAQKTGEALHIASENAFGVAVEFIGPDG